MAKLKLFRTAIGFHDAYVAATSRKAALAAWGSDKDLFARGAAEEVSDPDVAPEALVAPGTVVRRLRGTAAEQLAAAPPSARKPKPTAEDAPVRQRKSATPRRTPPPKPKPSRDALDAAEAAIAEREAALARERRAAERAAADEARRLTRDRDAARRDYDAAMHRWRG